LSDNWFRDEILPLERELRGYLRRFFADEEAKDIVQQYYAQICATSDFRAVQSPRAFLFVMARNLAVDRVRHDRVVPMELVAEI
jgi:DNA-directed RNA polymerase specialized sigma24 family protein